MRACRFLIAVCLLFGAAASIATAETIDYGDFTGPDITFIGVTEDSITDGLPLFDEPTLAGNSLVFNPASFEAFSEGGGIDLTDASLTMEIRSTNELGMSAINITEGGDFVVDGIGSDNTFVQIAAPVWVTIIEVDGLSIDPILITGSLEITPNGGNFQLVDGGNGVGSTWEGHLTVDLDAALAAAGIDGAATATRVLFNMDNTLIASSEDGSVAFIKKKSAIIGITPIVPEPSSIVLVGFGLLTLAGGLWRRRKR